MSTTYYDEVCRKVVGFEITEKSMTRSFIYLVKGAESMKTCNTSRTVRSIQQLKPQKTDRKHIARGPAGVVQHLLITGPYRPLRLLFISDRKLFPISMKY